MSRVWVHTIFFIAGERGMKNCLYKPDFVSEWKRKKQQPKQKTPQKKQLMIGSLAKALDSLGCHGDHHCSCFICR